MKQLIRNAIQTPDGTILESLHRHDYVEYTDKNGQYYAVDGGLDYQRTLFDKPDYKSLSVYIDASFEVIRENLKRGTHGKSGKEPFHYVLLKDMTEAHIKNCIEYEKQRSNTRFLRFYEQELEFRKNELKNNELG